MQLSLPAPFRQSFERELIRLDSLFDSNEGLIARPYHSPGYHTTLRAGIVHPIRDSLCYAIGLFDANRPGDWQRAEALLSRVLTFQDQRVDSPWCGTWPWFAEESIDQMDPPDMNWADFCSVLLLELLFSDRDGISLQLRHRMEEAVQVAVTAIMKRDVGPNYTNIAIMGGYATLAAGECLGNQTFMSYGRQRLRRSVDHLRDNGGFAEFNSPTYTLTSLHDTGRIIQYIKDDEGHSYGATLYQRFWEEIASHYHAPSGQWSGPHSRAYEVFLNDAARSLLDRALDGRLNAQPCQVTIPEHRISHQCPEHLVEHFLHLQTARMESQLFLNRMPSVIGNTYLHPGFALGSVTHGSYWEQCRPLLAYWGSKEQPQALRLRLLKDGHDLAAGQFCADQHHAQVLTAMSIDPAGGDRHPSLDKIPATGLYTENLRLVIELNAVNDFNIEQLKDRIFRIQMESVDLVIAGLGVDTVGRLVNLQIASGAERSSGCLLTEPLYEGDRPSNAPVAVLSLTFYSGEKRCLLPDELRQVFAGISLQCFSHSEKQSQSHWGVDAELSVWSEGLACGECRLMVPVPSILQSL